MNGARQMSEITTTFFIYANKKYIFKIFCDKNKRNAFV